MGGLRVGNTGYNHKNYLGEGGLTNKQSNSPLKIAKTELEKYTHAEHVLCIRNDFTSIHD